MISTQTQNKQNETKKKKRNLCKLTLTGFFTVVCSVPWPLNRSEAEHDLVLLQASLPFMCKSRHSHANKPVIIITCIGKVGRFVTEQVHLQPRFYSKARALRTKL